VPEADDLEDDTFDSAARAQHSLQVALKKAPTLGGRAPTAPTPAAAGSPHNPNRNFFKLALATLVSFSSIFTPLGDILHTARAAWTI
jgi:hypothetical protein